MQEVAHFLMLGAARAHDNSWVRDQCGVATIRSRLECRHVGLFRSMLAMMGSLATSNSPHPTWLLGPCKGTDTTHLDARGQPRARGRPWLQLFARDVEDGCKAGRVLNMPASILDYMNAPSFARGHYRSLLQTHLPREMIPRARRPRGQACHAPVAASSLRTSVECRSTTA